MTDQATYWSAAGGAWAEHEALLDRLHGPIGAAVEAEAWPGPDGRVLDVGCGAGATTLSMARRLGPSGRCLGVDISAPLLELARARAATEGAPQVEFLQADAATQPWDDGAFDAVMSRFGVMFFDDPVAAFANLRRAVRPGGRLAFACWRSPAENPLSQVPLAAAAPWVADLPRPAPDAPGRFAFADPDRVRRILDASGWRTVDIAPLDTPMPMAFEEAMTLCLRLGPLGTVLPRQTETVRAQVSEAVADRLHGLIVDGRIPMTAACWLVTAANG